FNFPASIPKKELLPPVVLLKPANAPKNELRMPAALALPALAPKKELPSPVLFAPAPTPANRLFDPALNTREPPRLNCVWASKMFAVPVPPLLKFVQDASSLRELRHKRFAPLVPRFVTTTVLVGVSANAGDPKNTPLVPPL